jgi:hypothetical protein
MTKVKVDQGKLYKFVRIHVEKCRVLSVEAMNAKYPLCLDCERQRIYGGKCGGEDECERDKAVSHQNGVIISRSKKK